MTRYLIAGAAGTLGHELRQALDGRDVAALGRDRLDVTDASATAAAVAGADVVINAAAFTAVDSAEKHEQAAFAINALGAGNLARAAAATGARFVHVSTDYVFHGDATAPYDESSPLDPVGAYGRTKAEGERLVRAEHPGAYVVRTAWLYGRHGVNFPRTILRLARENDTIPVVTDQVGQPTWARDLADCIVNLLDADAPAGVYHGTNAGSATWFEFARAVFAFSGLDPVRIVPALSAELGRPAPRPAYSVLGHSAWARAGLPAPRDWRDALAAAAADGAFTGMVEA